MNREQTFPFNSEGINCCPNITSCGGSEKRADGTQDPLRPFLDSNGSQ
jgi:hypothetical protein